MRQNFEQCMGWLLEHEGGYVNHPSDPGGETNLGVTRAVYEQYAGRQVMDGEMEGLTHDDVYPIYKENYWDRVRADDLPSGVDWAVFDWGVNSGTSRAAKALQRIIGVEQDGGIGPMTLQAVASVESAGIIDQLHYMREGFYRDLSTFDTFGRGWIRRNDETKEQALNLLN
jgi:lysozyme family protein|tara:strand:- start:124 stop:636 length:513 start_codon:yes stop_codon:yes gene_type:complete